MFLGGGGSVTNASTANHTALIQGYGGVDIQGAAGTVTNFGTIAGTAAGTFGHYLEGFVGAGVLLGDGGSITNGSNGDIGALIEAGLTAYGVVVRGAAGTVANFGTISATTAVALYSGGSVTNGSHGDTTALLQGHVVGYNSVGVYIGGGAGTVTNFGTVTAYQNGVLLQSGDVTNFGTITSPFRGAFIFGGAGTVANFGAITTDGIGVILGYGGTVTNGSSGDTNALIQGTYLFGVLSSGPATIKNFGTIASKYLGVYMQYGGTVTNGSLGDTTALIEAGVDAFGAPLTVNNFGTITGSRYEGVILINGGSVTNGAVGDTSALITGNYAGVLSTYDRTNVTNFGTITASGIFGGVALRFNGGAVVNGSVADTRALIIGTNSYGVIGATTVTNFGTISGGSGGVLGYGTAFDFGAWSLTNAASPTTPR